MFAFAAKLITPTQLSRFRLRSAPAHSSFARSPLFLLRPPAMAQPAELKAALTRLQSLPGASVKESAGGAEGGGGGGGAEAASIYDHLVTVIGQVLRSDAGTAIDLFGEASLAKRTAFGLGNNGGGGSKVPVAPAKAQNQSKISALQDALDVFVVPQPPINEETGEPEPREPLNEFTAADLFTHSAMLSAVGSGLSAAETAAVCLGMTRLAADPDTKIKSIRFFGKVLAKQADYYIFETELHSYEGEDVSNLEKEVAEATAYHDRVVEAAVALESQGGGEQGADADANANAEGGDDDNAAAKDTPVPPEEPASGTNEFVYWVSTSPGGKCARLPHVLPSQIVASRGIQKIFTGDLEAEVKAAVPFLGYEKHLLRAVIARIASDTVLCPSGYYIVDEETEEVQLNEEFECPEDLKAPGSWVHKHASILAQGRCSFWSEPKADDDDNEDEEEENEEAKGREPLASIEGDKLLLGTRTQFSDAAADDIPWTIFTHSAQPAMQHTIAAARSKQWPGAVSVMSKQTFASVYIGDGISRHPFGPPLPLPLQDEFVPPAAENDDGDEDEPEDPAADDDEQGDGEGQAKVKDDLVLKEVDDLPPKPEPEGEDAEGEEEGGEDEDEE